jgi:DnaK suppressor protein
MSTEKLEQYRQKLLALRDRVMGEVSHVAEAIQEDASTLQNLSSVPIHLADVAPDGLDADVHVLETERGILEEITAALNRIGDGTFGTCQSCGRPIGEQRLQALPYAALCIGCARTREQQPT